MFLTFRFFEKIKGLCRVTVAICTKAAELDKRRGADVRGRVTYWNFLEVVEEFGHFWCLIGMRLPSI
ncbi:hypothetical protein L596_023013 [Steinernema carpocapsae]|uniref:Uncharacterized protein n=1 Tax=Steinernema carpocapsae TaxID=34508 RepID=A0A4U5MCB9_STECR|nr:hypothetical protein L596_023013 [Steinernema carpocapsae]